MSSKKITLLAGKDFWETVPIPEKGVPAIKVRLATITMDVHLFTGGTRAACFLLQYARPQRGILQTESGLAIALAEETKTKSARVLLAPTMCNHRHPLGGRNFESFSEDPYLAGKMAANVRIYMKPFEITVKEANPLAVMTSYNKVNGTHADSNEFLLKQVLPWRMGLEWPHYERLGCVEAVTEAVKRGEVTESIITERARNILNLIEKVGAFENPEIPPERSIGITLLKNDGVLPLRKEQVKGKKIGLFGLAKEALIHGGGSASLNAHYRITPEEGLKSAYGDDVEFKLRFSPLLEHQAKHSEVCFGATFYPAESGLHYLGCSGIGPTTVYIGGELVFEQKHNSPDAMGFLFGGNPEKEFRVPLIKDQCYKIEIISKPPTGSNDDAGILDGLPGFRLGFMYESEHDKDLAAEAQDVAKDCDYAIVFTGHTPVWETEGQDQASFHLPREGTQDKLITAVSSVNPKTIVVNSTGVAVALPWLDNVAALVQAWFPGQEAGNAIADILSGAVNPSGHLPISWPKRIEDAPAHGNFPGERDDSGQLTVKYAEGVFVGYRHYDRLDKGKVHFPFGFGLSYTTFTISNAAVAKLAEGTFNASARVTNTGSVAGAVVVQLYVGRKEKSSEHPAKTLAAFHKVVLPPGREAVVLLPFANRDFAYFDDEAKEWVVEKDLYEFSFAQSAGHVDEVIELELEGVRGLKI
ncbi:glycoside hydrolase [Bipolaris maydis]|nr:glycoside hydrolase [Bipolaris maydis]